MLKYKAVYDLGLTAFLGDENSYSHAAAQMLTDGKLKGYDTLSKVIDAVISGATDAAVVPTENSVEGAVNEVYDVLSDSGLYIAHQIVLPIRHSLIAAENATMQSIKRIRSHPQAIGQCRSFLSKLNVTVEAVSSTSAAIALVDGESAAIGFKPKAGQKAIATGIQDSMLNSTRFSLLTKARSEKGGTVSVSFDLKNSPGSLFNALGVMSGAGVNMTRIISRPHRSGDGRYRFFVDFDYADDTVALERFLEKVACACDGLWFLGRYDVTVADNI
ncbi:MAG: ACT domain-containing protein [Clostridiales bacterium]|nr:ACT domain-containing protein [Clostridiales bacterium]